ncbi:MAG: SMC-Scp complex subunit ScpB [Cellvibrionaceae bacterium]
MSFDKQLLTQIIEGALLAVGQPMTVEKMLTLFDEDDEMHPKPAKEDVKDTLETIQQNCEGRGFELVEVGSGWRFQVRKETAPWVNRLWDEKPQKYSRALLETIALIAYRQPITRGDIEEIRGVAVSSHIIKTLTEREWIKVVGHRDVPGRPSLYATTRGFLDYFNLKSLEELPSLGEIKDLEELNKELDLGGDIPADVKQTLELPSEEAEEGTDQGAEEEAAKDNQDLDADGESAEVEPVVLEGTGEGEDFEPNADAFETGWIDDGEDAEGDDSSTQESPEVPDEDAQRLSDDSSAPMGESAFEESGLDEDALSEAAVSIAVDDGSEEEPSALDKLMSGQAPEGYEDNQQSDSDENHNHNEDDEITSASKDGDADNDSEDDAEDTPSESESDSLFAPSTAPSVFD